MAAEPGSRTSHGPGGGMLRSLRIGGVLERAFWATLGSQIADYERVTRPHPRGWKRRIAYYEHPPVCLSRMDATSIRGIDGLRRVGTGTGPTLLEVAIFPSVRWPELERILAREPLAYATIRQKGSHRTLESANGYPRLHLAFHDQAEIPGGLLRKVLMGDIGLSEEEAQALF